MKKKYKSINVMKYKIMNTKYICIHRDSNFYFVLSKHLFITILISLDI